MDELRRVRCLFKRERPTLARTPLDQSGFQLPVDFRVHQEMKCYSLLLGARNTPSGSTHFSPEDDDQLRTITFRHFPEGFTILNAEGGWFDPKQKRFIEEQSRQILVCAADPRKLGPWCAELAQGLNQDELLVVEHGRAATYRPLIAQQPRALPQARIRRRTKKRA